MALSEGDRMPAFALTDDRGTTVDSASLIGAKLVLYFFPRAFTPGCTTEACDFRDRHETFAAAGYRILGISPDPPQELARFRADHGLPFPLLSDPGHEVASAFGAWGPKKQYGREYDGMIRSTFVVDNDGTVVKAWRNVRAKGHAGRVAGALA
jgi:peroxiredoxin Q/BCP